MSYKTILVENGTKKEIVLKEYGVRENTSGGSSSFTGLIDTPTTYSGQAGKVVTVKGDEGGIEFTDLSTAGLQKVEDDTAPKLGGDLELGGFELTQASGNDFAIDVAGLATGDDFIIKSGASELLNLSFDSDNSEMLLDLSKSGLSTRIIGLPTNQTPIPSEALSYQYLVDNGVLNPMVDNLNAGKQSIVDTSILFFGETDEPEASGFGIQAVSSGAIPAITSSKTAEFTTLDSENTIVIAPEIGQPIMVTGDGGASVTMTYPSLDGTAGQVLTTNGAGESNWADAAQDAPVDSVDGRTGVITLDDLYAPITHTHTKSEITDFSDDDYATSAQGDLADTSIQAEDLDYGTFVGEDTDGFTGFLTKVEDDLTPKLGGDLETNGNDINGGTGNLTLNSFVFPTVDGTNGQVLVTNGANGLEFRTVESGSGSSDWNDITNKPTEFTPETHTHTEAQITDLDKYTVAQVDAALALKQDQASAFNGSYGSLTGVPVKFTPEDHTHTEADITDLDKYTKAEVDAAILAGGGASSWNDLTDKPTEFAPSAHTHTESEITDLDKYTKAEVDAAIAGVVTFSGDYNDLANTPTEFTPEVHTHTKSEITDFSDSDYATSAQGDTADSAVQPTELDFGTYEGEDTDGFTGFLTKVEDDLTPKLGGDLETNGNDINGGTGNLTLNSFVFPDTDGTDGQVLVTTGTNELEFRTIQSGGGSSDWNDITNKPTEFTPSSHTHVKSEITDFSDSDYATSAQGALADTAVQPGDLPEDAVTTVHSRTGDIVAEEGDYALYYASLIHTHTEADITDLDKYTQAEVDSALALKQDQASAFDGAYGSLTGTPTEFTPSAHTHTEADITDLDKYTQAEVDAAIAGATDDAVSIKTKYESNADTNAFTDNDKAQTDLVQDLGTFTGETIQPNVDLKVALQDLETEVERSRPFDANITIVEDFYDAVNAGVTHNTQIPPGTITNKSASADGRSIGFNYVAGTPQPFKLAFNDTFTEPYLWGGDGDFGAVDATWVDVDIAGLVLGAVVTINFWIRRATSATPRLCTWTRDPDGAAELLFTDNGGTVDELGTITFTAGGPTETLRIFLQRVMLKEITVNVQGTYSSTRLTDSSDVEITSPVVDNVLAYTSNNKWENVPITSMSAFSVLSSFQTGQHSGPELMQFIVDAIEEKLLSQQRVVKNITVRPANPEIGDQYFDSTLNKVLVWAGARWLDSNGNNV